MSHICSTSTVLGTNGLNNTDVPLSNKLTNTHLYTNNLNTVGVSLNNNDVLLQLGTMSRN